MKMIFDVKGLRVEKFIQKINEKEYIENERYCFNCTRDKTKYEILLYFDYSSKTQKKAEIVITPVEHYIGTNYRTRRKFSIILNSESDEHHNDAFDFNKYSINVKWENFIKTVRMKKYRPVWIFIGESTLGKSYISTILSNNSNLIVYETDSNPNLPNILFQDIINVGNKYKFELEEIEKRIYGNHESIIVNFLKKEL